MAATRISARYQPKVRASDAGRAATQMAPRASAMPATSVNTWPASASRARLFASDAADQLEHQDREADDEHDGERPPIPVRRAVRVMVDHRVMVPAQSDRDAPWYRQRSRGLATIDSIDIESISCES